jgi:HNH endonuclease/NUMOD4 motif/Sigma-70, region 4
MSETWRQVVGYEGLYEVSDLGRIRRSVDLPASQYLHPGRLLSPSIDRDGYLRISLLQRGRSTTQTVHRVVAAAFIGPRPVNAEINHKDGAKTNNAVSNLEYTTRRENAIHALRVLGRGPDNRGSRQGASKLSEFQAWVVRRMYEERNFTLREIGRIFNVSLATVCQIGKGIRWRHIT